MAHAQSVTILLRVESLNVFAPKMRKAVGCHDPLSYLIEICDAPSLLRLNIGDSGTSPIQLFS